MKLLLALGTALLIYGFIEYLKTTSLISIGEELARKAKPFHREFNLSDERILIIGDSTAFGTGASSPETSLAGLIAKRYPDASIENFGVNGMKTAELLEKITELKDERYSLIQIHIGGNDIVRRTDLTELEEDLKDVLDIANTMTSQVILVTCGNVGTSLLLPYPSRWFFEQRTREVREIFTAIAQEKAVDYVDLFHEKDEDPFAKDPKKYYAADLFHPSDDGYAFWFEQIRNYYPLRLE